MHTNAIANLSRVFKNVYYGSIFFWYSVGSNNSTEDISFISWQPTITVFEINRNLFAVHEVSSP